MTQLRLKKPLFVEEAFKIEPMDRELTTLTVGTIETEVQPIQSDQGSNVSITLFYHLVHDYIPVTPFPICHVSRQGPALIANGY